MKENTVGIKDRITKLLVVIAVCLICVLIQGVLFYLDKTIYLGCFLMLTAVTFLIHIGLSDREILILDGLFFIICPIFLIIGNFDLSNYIALNIISLSLLYIAVYLFRKKIAGKSKNSNFKMALKYILIIMAAGFIVLSVFIGKEETNHALQRFFNPREYYRGIERIEVNGSEYENRMKIVIDTPKNGSEVSGLFVIEGWATDFCFLEDACIDTIYVVANRHLNDGGDIFSRIDTKKRREDVANQYGERYKDAGYYIVVDSKKFDNGLNKFYIYAHSNYFGWKYAETEVYIDN